MSPLYTIFRFVEGRNDFLDFFFQTNRWHDYMRAVGSSGARHDRLSVSICDFMNLPILFPPLPEQQKIADCLTSLDELIRAEGEVLAALRDHKCGLMQRLFPRPGETTPRLRFPEFRDAGPWEVKRLGELGELIPGLTYDPADVRDDGLLVLRSSNIRDGQIDLNDRVFVDVEVSGATLLQKDDILICVRNGSRDLIGKNALLPEGLPRCTHGAFMSAFRGNESRFVFYLFQTQQYLHQVSADLGATINSINAGNLVRYRFSVPSQQAEQHKIAECLASLDELIRAQGARLAALKAHKRGLMQQLFPQGIA